MRVISSVCHFHLLTLNLDGRRHIDTINNSFKLGVNYAMDAFGAHYKWCESLRWKSTVFPRFFKRIFLLLREKGQL